jgi:Ca-activated chloride channel family protein
VKCHHGSSEPHEKPSLSIAAALDRSASMRGPKLADMKVAARALIDRLGPRDRLALVAFDAGAEVLAAGPVVDREDLYRKVGRIECLSGTNIQLALETAGRYLRADPDAKSVKRLLLLTDGEASLGDTSADGLARIAAAHANFEIVTTCLGFGLEYDEQVLDQIATAGAGRLHHVDTTGKLADIYAAELDRMRALVAPWISVSVIPSEEARVHGSRNTYPMKRKGRGFELEISDLSEDEARWVIFDLHVPPAPRSDEAPLATVIVQWRDIRGELHEKRQEVVARYGDDETVKKAEKNGAVLEQIALLDVAAAKARALADSARGDIQEGSVRLQNTLARIAGSTSYRSNKLESELDKLGTLKAMMERNEIDEGTRKRVQVEVHEGRTPTFRIDLGDAPPV